ncbi:MAG: ATP-binding protein [Hyalangium sp.]|uniref:ATP-binding protein n=1 Tax=Hyalangium sp. TaxID=2028555 RepID=UPI003899D876
MSPSSSRPEFIHAERQFARSVLGGLLFLGLVAVTGPLLSYRSDVAEVRAWHAHRVAHEAQVYADALGLHLQSLATELRRVTKDLGPRLEVEALAAEDMSDLTTPQGLFHTGAMLLDDAGQVRWSDPPRQASSESFRNRPWFQQVLAQRAPIVDSLAPGSSSFVVAVPVERQGRLVGVLAGLLDAAEGLPGGRPVGENLELLVLNRAGDVFLPESPPRWASNPSFARTLREMLAESSMPVTLAGREVYASATPVPGTELVLVLAADESPFLAGIHARVLMQLFVIALLQVGTLVLFGFHWRRVYALFLAMEERTAQQEKMAALGGAASLIAHEVKNSLNGLKAATGLLSGQSEQGLVVRTLSGQIDRLAHLATSLLHFGRPPMPQRTPADLTQLAREVVEALRTLPEAEEVQVEVETPERLPLSCDPLLLTTALDNLVRNAMEATVAAKDLGKLSTPTVRVQVRQEAGAAVVDVEDNAGGPPVELEGRLFEPFVTSKPKGIGLGLAMTQQAVEQQGGSLTFERILGGSRFRIRLPLQEPNP